MRLFVYGTLKVGFRNHHLLKGSRFLREQTIKGYKMYSLGSFPAIKQEAGVVHGEIYWISPTILPALDRLESAYNRVYDPEYRVHLYVFKYPCNVEVLSGKWQEVSGRSDRDSQAEGVVVPPVVHQLQDGAGA